MEGHSEPQVVHAIFTQTSVYTSPEGEVFPYFNIECIMEGGQPGANLLFNPALAVGIMGDIVKLLKVMFGVGEQEMNLDPNQLEMPLDWDNLPPAPNDPMQDIDPQDPPDRYGDR